MTLFSPKQLSVTNFKAVRGLVEVNFDQQPGLYFVAGRNELEPRLGANGAAKSTLFCEAISWAISGRLSRSNRPGSDVENWHTNGTTKVVFVFALGEDEHQIGRSRNPNNLLLDGVKVEQRDIDALLPLSDAALRRTILIDQFCQMFLSLRPEDKSRIFSETLNLELWTVASDKAAAELKIIEQNVTKIEKEIASLSGSIAEVRDQLESAQTKEKEFEDDVEDKLKQAKAARRKLKDAANAAFDALNDARDVNSKFNNLDDSKVDLERKRRLERQTIQAMAEAKAARDSVGGRRALLAEQLDEYNETDVCPECGQKVSKKHIQEKRLELIKQIDEYGKRFDDLCEATESIPNELLKIQNQIAKLEEELVDYNKAQSLVAERAGLSIAADREWNRAKERVIELEQLENVFTEQCKRLEKRLTKLRSDRDEEKKALSELNAESEIYKFWQNGFREIRLEQIDATLIELELATNRHAEELGLDGWDLQFQTERETKSGNISHSFSVLLYPPGQKNAVAWENYSGGESQRLQLATTFGLSEVLLSRAGIDTDFELLDEPSTHLSPEGIDDLLACLRERALEQNRRIFLIDHNSLDKGSFDNVYTVVKDKDGVHIE